ncbi:MAG: DNA replication/repair protein RecF [Bacteroidetes bacterium]|nr:DNA replication/repair protein RecF [Bacteroidota bacterium]
MFLKSLSISNFKNYTEASLRFSEKINCFVGNNGEGKTNLLDAIYYLSFCKSYFNLIDMQNIKHETDFFAIHGQYVRMDEQQDTVSCIQKKNQRKVFKINKKEYDRLADHIGLFPLVMVSPYDRDLINEGSDVRRKYIDSVISQFDRIYLDDLMNYNKALQQRNALLKQFAENNRFDASSVELWNMHLQKHGENIYQKRKLFLKEFIPLFQQYFAFISGGKEKVNIDYQSQLNDNDMESLLKENIYRDRALQYTTVGIHKDDLDFMMDEFAVKKFGSQGQQKSFFIALKLAQFEYTKNIKGFKPILLFDDIFDKLDNSRVEQLINLVADQSFKQVFITDTNAERIAAIFDKIKIPHKIFNIEKGTVTEISTHV